MSTADKACKRLMSRPKDFTWEELATVMKSFDYELKTGSGGSGRKFIHRLTQATFMVHEPHPAKVLKAYQVAGAINFLKQEKHIK